MPKKKEKAPEAKAVHNIIYPDGGIGYKPKSGYIHERIKELSFSRKENREYIRGLSRLEEFILEGAHSWAGGMLYNSLRHDYPKEYDAIYRELKPAEYEKILEQKRKEQIESEKRRKQYDEELARGLKNYESWWLSVGGKK